MEKEEIKAKPTSKSQLAGMYGVSLVTLNKWLEPFKNDIGKYRGKCYTPLQIEIIFKSLGNP